MYPSIAHACSCHNIGTMPKNQIPQFPDLTPLEFFAWGFIKFVAYKQKIETVYELKKRNIRAIHLITPDMLRNTWRKLDYRLDICRATKIAQNEIC